jgi:hypothetical protein
MIRLVSGFILFLLFIAFSIDLNAQQSQFDYANQLMEEQRIEEAFEVYKSIHSDGYQSGELYYNMALASMFQDSLGLAKFYLLQSAQFPETQQDANRTLEYVNEQFNRRSAILPKLPWERFFEWLNDTFGASVLFIIGTILFNAGIGFIIGGLFVDKYSKWLLRTGYLLGIISILIVLSSFYIDYLDERFETAVMIDRQTIVHQRPSDTSASVSNAFEGYTMTVDKQRSAEENNWLYVRLENGMYGWIEEQRVRTF